MNRKIVQQSEAHAGALTELLEKSCAGGKGHTDDQLLLFDCFDSTTNGSNFV